MPVLWPLFRRREPFTLGETPLRAGCGLLLEEKNPDRRQLPNVEVVGIRSRSVRYQKLSPGCRRRKSLTATYNSLRLLMARVRYEDVKRSKDRSETLSRGRINVTRELAKLASPTIMAKPFVDETISKSAISPPRVASVMLIWDRPYSSSGQ